MNKFQNIRHKNGEVVDFKELLTTVYNAPKEDLPLFNFSNNTSATYKSGDKTNAIVLDYDDGTITYEQFIQKHRDYKMFVYTTSSNSTECSKFRVVFQLSAYYDFDDIELAVKTNFPGVDPCTSSKNRRFYWVSEYDKDGQPTKRYWNPTGKVWDEVNHIFNTHLLDDLKRFEYRPKQVVFSGVCNGLCSTFDYVLEYLNTPYPNVKGNGGASRLGLFKSVKACQKYNDQATLEKVLNKARNERWSEKELQAILNYEKKC